MTEESIFIIRQNAIAEAVKLVSLSEGIYVGRNVVEVAREIEDYMLGKLPEKR